MGKSVLLSASEISLYATGDSAAFESVELPIGCVAFQKISMGQRAAIYQKPPPAK
jgi:hypothetical protein